MERDYYLRWSRVWEPTLLTDFSGGFSTGKIMAYITVAVFILWALGSGKQVMPACLVAFVFAFLFISPVIMPEKTVCLLNGKVHIYTAGQNKYELIFPSLKKILIASEYETMPVIASNGPKYALLFKAPETGKWYYVNKEASEPVCIGERLNQMLYLKTGEGKKILSVMDYGKIMQIKIENCYYKNFCTVPGFWSLKNIPDELLLLKTDGMYKLFGLYGKEDKKFHSKVLRGKDIKDIGIYFYENGALVWLLGQENGFVETSRHKVNASV